MIRKQRAEREAELRSMLKDPVGRIVLERWFFEATKSIAPQQADAALLDAILAHEYEEQPVRSQHRTRPT